MSIFGADGKPVDTDMLGEPKVYEIGGIRVETPLTPQTALQRAMVGAQQGIAQNVMMQAAAQGASQAQAQAAASEAAGSIKSPFQVEPCAEAVFMLMTQELAKRDVLISALASRLKELDGKDLPTRAADEASPNPDAN
jgi:hypothetical protein